MNRSQGSFQAGRALALSLVALGLPGAAQVVLPLDAPAAVARTVPVPRQKVTLTCTDPYFRSPRQNFLLSDEAYPHCTLRLPLALRERWPGRRTFYFIPRVAATLYTKGSKGNGHWLPLSPLVNLGGDPLHRAVSSETYRAVELGGSFAKLGEVAGQDKPDTVSVGGKLTVCVAPVLAGEQPCTTFDITARYRVYLR